MHECEFLPNVEEQSKNWDTLCANMDIFKTGLDTYWCLEFKRQSHWFYSKECWRSGWHECFNQLIYQTLNCMVFEYLRHYNIQYSDPNCMVHFYCLRSAVGLVPSHRAIQTWSSCWKGSERWCSPSGWPRTRRSPSRVVDSNDPSRQQKCTHFPVEMKGPLKDFF